MADLSRQMFLPVQHYDLDETLSSGQAFRWKRQSGGWESVVGGRWIRLTTNQDGIAAEIAEGVQDWTWLAQYLQTQLVLDQVIKTFPADPPLNQAVQSCWGLRLLRQEPWECLASFILSSTK